MDMENWPEPKLGLRPNQDIFQSRCCWRSRSSSGVRRRRAEMARVKCLASVPGDVKNLNMTCCRERDAEISCDGQHGSDSPSGI